jgi:hypothetical protein
MSEILSTTLVHQWIQCRVFDLRRPWYARLASRNPILRVFRSMPVFFPWTRTTLSNSKNLSNVCVAVSCTFRSIAQEVYVQLTLTDRSVSVQRESSSALGQGCRLGFLGTLHMDVFRQRLEDEYDANIIVTAPTVPYKGELLLSLQNTVANDEI